MKKWILNIINSVLSFVYLKDENIKTFQDLEYKVQVPPSELTKLNKY